MKIRYIIFFTILYITVNSNLFSWSTLSPMEGGLATITNNHLSHRTNNGASLGGGNISKKGTSCRYYIFPIGYLFTGMGGSISDAIQEAGIKQIGVVDYETLNFLLVFTIECVVVWGE